MEGSNAQPTGCVSPTTAHCGCLPKSGCARILPMSCMKPARWNHGLSGCSLRHASAVCSRCWICERRACEKRTVCCSKGEALTVQDEESSSPLSPVASPSPGHCRPRLRSGALHNRRARRSGEQRRGKNRDVDSEWQPTLTCRLPQRHSTRVQPPEALFLLTGECERLQPVLLHVEGTHGLLSGRLLRRVVPERLAVVIQARGVLGLRRRTRYGGRHALPRWTWRRSGLTCSPSQWQGPLLGARRAECTRSRRR